MSDQPKSTHAILACPTCDLLYRPSATERLKCRRCHRTLMVPERRAGVLQVFIALVTAALIFGAVTLPFLSIERYWMRNDATLIETALAFEGPLRLLSLVILALILLLPTLRLGLTLYVLLPVVTSFRHLPGSARAFRLAEALRPWSMAEIFIIGCTVALIKIVALAEVTFGPAFYMFAGAVVLLWVQDRILCRQSLWDALGDD